MLSFSNLFEQSANDLANIKNQRFRGPSTVIIGYFEVNKSAYIAKSRQRYHKTFDIILLHVSNQVLKMCTCLIMEL